MNDSTQTIVFFDGLCGLCNGLVDFLIRKDTSGRLLFAPLQGSTAAARLSETERRDLDSIVVFYREKKFKHSTAVLMALSEIGAPWRSAAAIGMVFPEPLRNAIYRVIAKYRYAWFGKLDVCRIPSPEERKRFLD
jgi:predicted DCC family thiol-disulfide oxidoreductase YuxK